MSIIVINVCNQFKGKVKEIICGFVVFEVDVEMLFGIVMLVIIICLVDEFELKVGVEVVVFVKLMEVLIVCF